MAVRNRQIGWSPMSNALYEVLREINALKGQFAAPTTTTTTTIYYPPGMLTIDLGGLDGLFDMPLTASFGCWIKMTNDSSFPRIFSFGQYPGAYQAISIEGGSLIFWYAGSPYFLADFTPYIGQWTWVSFVSSTVGSTTLYINGSLIANTGTIGTVTPTSTLYIASENAPNTYYNGLMRDFVFDVGNTLSLQNVPTAPIVNTGNAILLLFQGTDIGQQLTDNGTFHLSVSNSGAVYNADSPYVGFPGSIQFGAI